jgi:hypothetical protein
MRLRRWGSLCHASFISLPWVPGRYTSPSGRCSDSHESLNATELRVRPGINTIRHQRDCLGRSAEPEVWSFVCCSNVSQQRLLWASTLRFPRGAGQAAARIGERLRGLWAGAARPQGALRELAHGHCLSAVSGSERSEFGRGPLHTRCAGKSPLQRRPLDLRAAACPATPEGGSVRTTPLGFDRLSPNGGGSARTEGARPERRRLNLNRGRSARMEQWGSLP